MTKDSLHHAGKNGQHSYGENLHNAAKNGEHSCVENFYGDNLNPHNINKLSCTHQSLQETQHLCHPEHCLIFVGPEHQASKIYEYLTWKHIKSYHAGQGSQQPSLLDGNHNMSIFSLFNKYVQIEQGFHPVKKFSNHEPSLTEDVLGDHHSSFFHYLSHIDYDAKPKEFFTQELWGELQQRTSSTPLMKYLNDSLDNGQTEDNFFNFKSIKEYRGLYSLPDPGHLESIYNLLTEWDPGEIYIHYHTRFQALWKFQSKTCH